MLFCLRLDDHLQSTKIIPKFLPKSPCAARVSSKTSGYSFLRDNWYYPEIRDNQELSLAGRRLGLADARSGLFMEAIRIIREMREATHGKYPKFALWENVPGALSSNGRRDYQAVLAAFTDVEIPMPESGRWANAGMVRGGGVDLAWCVYDAQYFGTAQRRRRLFLVCDFGGTRAGEILFVPKSLRRYFEAGGTPWQGITAFAEGGAGTAGAVVTNPGAFPGPLCMGTGQANAAILRNQSPTLTAAHEQPLCLYPRVAGTLCASGAGLSRPAGMGSELDFCVVSAGFKHKASASAGSIGYREEPAPTLVAGQESGVIKAYVIGAYCSGGMISENPHSGIYEAETSRTLDLNGGNPCCQQGGTVIVTGCRVRRLTPTEAERLMGFPDGWTARGCDGKEISDSMRYKMLGNSIAVPCVAYLMQGITDVLGRGDAI